MQLNPKSIQIAGVATATLVALGLAVASADKVEPTAQRVATRATPGPAAVEAEDRPTPKPSATPTPKPSPTVSSSDGDDSKDNDDNDEDSREELVRRWQKAAEERREKAVEARKEWADNWQKQSEQRRKENRKRLEKMVKEQERAHRQAQNHAWDSD
jgi:hypothetical protein